MRSGGTPTALIASMIAALFSEICFVDGDSGGDRVSILLSEGGLPTFSLPGGPEERVGPGKPEGLSVLPPLRRASISNAVRSHVFGLPLKSRLMTARDVPSASRMRFSV